MSKRILQYSAFLSLSISVVSGWRMWMLDSSGELWSHWPLMLFTSFWIFFGLLSISGKEHLSGHSRYLTLGIIGAALLTLGFPPFPTTFTIFVGFVPFLFLEKEIAEDVRINNPLKASLFYGYFGFVLWNILTTFWVANTALVAGVFAILANSLLMLIPWLAFILFRKYVGDRTAYFTFVAFWITFEYLHMQWEVTWPWLTLGNALSQYAWLPQWYSYLGVFGGSFWILMANVFFFQILHKQRIGGLSNRRIIGFGFWIFIPVLISVWMYSQYKPAGEEVEVVIVQPNFEPHYEKFNIPASIQIERFKELSVNAITNNTKYLLYPETSLESVNVDQISSHVDYKKVGEILKDYPGLYWVTGISAYKIFPRYVPGRPNLRTSVRGDMTTYWEAYNAATQTNHLLEDIQFYTKSRLVPGPEIFPYKEYLQFMKPLIDKLDGTVEGLATQPDRAVFRSDQYAVAPVICYESIFGEYCTGYVKNGAQAIFIMTNDGWWDRTAGHLQHLYFGRLRAIETRRDIARSANSGISCFIDQRGLILSATNYDEAVAIRSNIRMNDKITFYTQWGDIIGRLALFVSLFQVLYIVFGFIKRRYKVL